MRYTRTRRSTAGDVFLGQEEVRRQVDAHGRLLDVAGALAACLRDRLPQHLRKQIEAHARQVAVLLGADQRAGASDLEVAHGDAHAASQVLEFGERGQARRCLLRQRQLAGEHEVRVRLRGGAPHTALDW